jgi:hypothetical protein
MDKNAAHSIWKVLMHATKNNLVPDGYYGPETCRWATREEMQRFNLETAPLVHLGRDGNGDCYFTETKAVVVELS